MPTSSLEARWVRNADNCPPGTGQCWEGRPRSRRPVQARTRPSRLADGRDERLRATALMRDTVRHASLGAAKMTGLGCRTTGGARKQQDLTLRQRATGTSGTRLHCGERRLARRRPTLSRRWAAMFGGNFRAAGHGLATSPGARPVPPAASSRVTRPYFHDRREGAA